MSKAEHGQHHAERPIGDLLSVATLFEEARLARIYVYILRHESATVEELTEELDIAQSTAYADVAELTEQGVLTRDASERFHQFSAKPIALTLRSDGDEYTVTPTFIEAIARRAEDSDLDLFIDRHGIETLAAALEYAIPYANGEMGERIAARELGLQPIEGITILHVLREVVLDMRDLDPFFDRIGNARTDVDHSAPVE
jgi:DNA-binding transcriptional ArsR family regulator